jgi:hypothetical protein
MPEQEYIFEYELIDISFEQGYELPEDDVVWRVSEDAPSQNDEHKEIEYDADGIPMGQSMEEIRKREGLIGEFFKTWRDRFDEGKIFNEALQDFIYIKGISVIEAKEHSSKSYNSTRAIMILDEVMKNAQPVRRVAVKGNDRNQQMFAYMLVMVYRHVELGTIKLTVGVKHSKQRVEYGVSALRPGEPLIKNEQQPKTKKRRSHK